MQSMTCTEFTPKPLILNGLEKRESLQTSKFVAHQPDSRMPHPYPPLSQTGWEIVSPGHLLPRHQPRELRQIDVSPANHADNLARAAFHALPGRYGASARALGDHVIALSYKFHGLTNLLQRRNDRPGQQMICQRPHPRKDRLAAATVHETRLPLGKTLRPPRRKRTRERGSRFRLRGEHLHLRSPLFHRGGNAARQTSTAERSYDAIHVGQVFQDFQPRRGIAGDELVVLKRMHKGSAHRRMRAFGQGCPALVERRHDYLGAQPTCCIQLGGGSGIHHEHLARHADLARCQRHSLGSVTGTDGPHAVPPLLFGQQPNRVVRSSNLERPDGLQALQLQVDFGGPVIVQPHQRSAYRRFVNVLARVLDESGRNVSLRRLHIRRGFSCHRKTSYRPPTIHAPAILSQTSLIYLTLRLAREYNLTTVQLPADTERAIDKRLRAGDPVASADMAEV